MIIDVHGHLTAPDNLYVYKANILSHYVIADGSSVVFVAQADIGRVVEAAELIVQRESLMAQALRDGKRASEVMGANYEHMLKK